MTAHARIHRVLAIAEAAGLHYDTLHVDDTDVTVVTNRVTACRWREAFGEHLLPGVPLYVWGLDRVGGAS